MPAPRQRRVLKTTAVVVALASLSGGAWALQRWKPFAHEAAEVAWPQNLADIAEFVEQTSGLHFLRGVEVEYLTGAEFDSRIDLAFPFPNPDPAEDAARDAAGRALGLWAGDFQRLEGERLLTDWHPQVAWVHDENVLVVRAAKSSSTLTPAAKTEAALELTYALVDQHFHVRVRADAAPTRQEFLALQSVDVGFAVWMQQQYVDDGLTAKERTRYYDDIFDDSIEYDESTTDVAPAYRALRTAASQLGLAFIELNSARRAQLHQVLSDDSPVALDQVALPVSKYQRRDTLESVEQPRAPEGAQHLYDDQAGPLTLHLMISTGMPSNEALTAADGWGNDAFVVYRLDGAVCVDLHVVADSRADAHRLEAGLTAWAQARPPEAHALIGRDDVHLYVSACDPGTDVSQRVPTTGDADHFLDRANLIYSLGGRRPERAECVGVTIFEQFDADELYSFEFDYFAEIAAAQQECADAT